MHTTAPPPESGSPVLRAVATALLIVFAPLVVLLRILAYLGAAAYARWARWRSRSACRRLGERMFAVEIGDQFLRDRIAEARRGLADKPPADRRRVYAADLREGLESLGKSGAAAGVPVMGAEREYHAALAAYDRRNTSQAARSAAAARILPHTVLGWLALLAGCAATGGIVYLLVAGL